jgi:molybdate transport system substrate-binding protein
MSVPSQAAEPVRLYAAGSLRPALTQAAAAFEAKTGVKVQAKFGPSGTLRDEIAGGAPAELFASANMEHPQALANAGKSGPVVLFARNRLCLLARPALRIDAAGVLTALLDPALKLGTSTPKADPAGDYAWEVFRKAEAFQPGARAVLEGKALQLVGGPGAPTAPPGRSVYGMLIAEGQADPFLT